MKIRIEMFAAAALALLLVAAWPVNAPKAQAYWGYGVGYTERGQDWQEGGYGMGRKHIAPGISMGLVMRRPG
jgi:hypothetical protein